VRSRGEEGQGGNHRDLLFPDTHKHRPKNSSFLVQEDGDDASGDLCKGVGRQDAENQLRQLRAIAETQSWTVVDEYVDRLSGKTADREQFQHMFHSASVRGFDVLLFWSLDRLSREGTVATLNHL
jgi:hypothetical protein